MNKKLSPRGVYERSLTEEDVVTQIRQLLEINGARVHRIVERIPWGKRKSEPGVPDLFGWFDGKVLDPFLPAQRPIMWVGGEPDEVGWRLGEYHLGVLNTVHFFIEVKRPGGKHRPAQTAWIEAARRDGVIAFFADSVEAMVAGFAEFGIRIRGR